MTTATWIIILSVTAVIVLASHMVGKEGNRPDPPTPDRGGVPRKSEQLKSAIACEVRNGLKMPQKVYPLGMHYAPDEPIVPKRRKRTYAIGRYRDGETFAILFNDEHTPGEVLDVVTQWARRDDLAFDQVDRVAVMEKIFTMRGE